MDDPSNGFTQYKNATPSTCVGESEIEAFHVRSSSDHAVVLQWLECDSNPYSIRGQEKGSGLWTWFDKDTPIIGNAPGTNTLTIAHLTQTKLYRFEIVNGQNMTVAKLEFSITGELFSGAQYTGTTYYVSPKGNDANPGTGQGKPIKTLTKVQQILNTANAPINILFERGGQWLGSLTLPEIPGASQSLPVQLGAYGQGAAPQIVGSKNMSGASWLSNTNGTYALNVDMPGVGALFIDQKMYYPAKSPLLQIVDGNSTSLSAAQLHAINMFDGMQITFRGTHWSAETREVDQIFNSVINGQNVGTVTWTIQNNLPNKGKVNNGAYLYNHPNFVSKPYDWTYDTAKQTLQFFPGPNGLNQDIRIPQHVYGLTVLGDHYRIRDLALHYYYKDAIFSEGEDLQVSYCDLSYNYNAGIYVYGDDTDGLVVTHNNIHDVSGVGVFAQRSNFSTITYNQIYNIGDAAWGRVTGLDGELGAANNQFLTGITFYSTQNNYIAYNQISQVGYVGIRFDGQNHVIEHNQIVDPLRRLSDGGGIYSFEAINAAFPTQLNVIEKNIIENNPADNMVGYKMNQPSAKLMQVSIYLDNRSKTTKVIDNVLKGCPEICLLLNRNNNHHTVEGNILYGEDKILQVTRSQKSTQSYHFIKRNLFVGLTDQTFMMYFLNQGKYPWDSGIYENNQYINPYSPWTGKDQNHPVQDKYDFNDWVSFIHETAPELLLDGLNFVSLTQAKQDIQLLINKTPFEKNILIAPGHITMPLSNKQIAGSINLMPHEAVITTNQ
ncbi:MAG: right-handed parallel beta-helix repeat-containing protein [Deltaproteobacteria bacterium]|nr:right-handed parallel beta-helix repeat-containing protein [Deltaproteobacteria bacterium]